MDDVDAVRELHLLDIAGKGVLEAAPAVVSSAVLAELRVERRVVGPDDVVAAIAVGDRVVGEHAAVDDGVDTIAADEVRVAAAREQHVVTRSAGQPVVAAEVGRHQHIITVTAHQARRTAVGAIPKEVVAVAPVDDGERKWIADHHVVATPAREQVELVVVGDDDVVAALAEHGIAALAVIGAGCPRHQNDVVAVTGENAVHAIAGGDDLVRIGALEPRLIHKRHLGRVIANEPALRTEIRHHIPVQDVVRFAGQSITCECRSIRRIEPHLRVLDPVVFYLDNRVREIANNVCVLLTLVDEVVVGDNDVASLSRAAV